MKIEMGESLFYSWLRHEKCCQVVQSNWKVSPKWKHRHTAKLKDLMVAIDDYFANKYNYSIFKGTHTLDQLLKQGECDLLGIQTTQNGYKFYAVDVAFHMDGLNYKNRIETVKSIIKKCVRTAFCLYEFMDATDSEVIFASPKITPAVKRDIDMCIADLNAFFKDEGFKFNFYVLANDIFNEKVLQPVLNLRGDIADTAELFLRGYQLSTMFSNETIAKKMQI